MGPIPNQEDKSRWWTCCKCAWNSQEVSYGSSVCPVCKHVQGSCCKQYPTEISVPPSAVDAGVHGELPEQFHSKLDLWDYSLHTRTHNLSERSDEFQKTYEELGVDPETFDEENANIEPSATGPKDLLVRAQSEVKDNYDNMKITEPSRSSNDELNDNTDEMQRTEQIKSFMKELKDRLAMAFADELFDSLAELESPGNVTFVTSEALELFAMLMGGSIASLEEALLIEIVSSERHSIAGRLHDKLDAKSHIHQFPLPTQVPERTWRHTLHGLLKLLPDQWSGIDRWVLHSMYVEADGSSPELPLRVSGFHVTIPELVSAFDIFTSTPEFTWLHSCICVSYSTSATGSEFNQVRRQIVSAVTGRDVVVFSLGWSPVDFLEEQYESPARTSLGEVICLAGSGSKVEAMTCAKYVSTIWPRLGTEILHAFDVATAAAMKSGFNYRSHVAHVVPGGSFTVNFTLAHTEIEVTNSDYSYMVEFGEIISWLSIVCQQESSPDGIAYMFPSVSRHDISGRYIITHEAIESGWEPIDGPESCLCWQNIFKNAKVCKGYPIMPRLNNERGLQIPLDIMATLGCATTATLYGKHLVLKGLCSVFLPMLKVGTSITWHYLANEDLSWMSYDVVHDRAHVISNIQFNDISNLTHFVGWSRSVQETIGSRDLEYDRIQAAKVHNVGPGCAWEGVTIGFSKIIEVSTKFSVGKRDSRIYPQRSGPYPRMVDIAAGMKVTFYDVPERRAWLTDGASALLLLTRTALSSHYSRGAGKKSREILDQFNEAVASLHSGATAIDILLCRKIRSIPLYGNEDRPQDLWHFESLVLEQWNLLDEMRSRQARVNTSGSSEVGTRSPISTRVEGFQFVDMISCTGPIRPKYAKTQMDEMCRTLLYKHDAVTVLGASFGQLLRPLRQDCKAITEVPSGCDVLIAPNRLLDPRFSSVGGTIHHDCVELVEDVFWAEPHKSFPSEPCPCTEIDQNGHCGKAVTVLEKSRPKGLKGQRDIDFEGLFGKISNGATVFGSDSSVRRAKGHHVECTEQRSTEASGESGHRSGTTVIESNDNLSSEKLMGQREPSVPKIFEAFPDGAITIGSEASAKGANRHHRDSTTQLSAQASGDSGYHSGSSLAGLNGNISSPTLPRQRPTRTLMSNCGSLFRRALGIKKANLGPSGQ